MFKAGDRVRIKDTAWTYRGYIGTVEAVSPSRRGNSCTYIVVLDGGDQSSKLFSADEIKLEA